MERRGANETVVTEVKKDPKESKEKPCKDKGSPIREGSGWLKVKDEDMIDAGTVPDQNVKAPHPEADHWYPHQPEHW